MKKFLLLVTMLFSLGAVNAQDVVDDFNVGPYEVYYKGLGDVNFRLKKGIDLYEYFGLKKDTIINIVEPKAEPLKNGIQVSAYFETAMYEIARYSMVYGIEGIWKHRIANYTYLNAGLSLGIASTTITNLEQDVLETGVPISIEWTNLNPRRTNLYGGIGVSPTYFSTMNASYKTAPEGVTPEKHNGVYVAPRVDVGCYVPVGSQYVKVGISWRYKFNCSGKDYNMYQMINGRTYIGANLGIIF